MNAWREYLGVVIILGVIALLVKSPNTAKVIDSAGQALNGTFKTVMGG